MPVGVWSHNKAVDQPRPRLRSLSAVLLGALLILCCSSCATAPPPQVGVLPSAEQVVTHLEERRRAVRSFVMQGDITAQAPEGDLDGSHLIQGIFPDRLRAEVMGPFGRPALLLVCDGARMSVIDYRNNRGYLGRAHRANLYRFLGLALSVEEIYTLLTGSVPLLADQAREVRPADTAGRAWLVLLEPGGAAAQSVLFDLGDYRVRGARLDRWQGGPTLTAAFRDFRSSTQGARPRTVELASPDQGRSLAIYNDRLGIDPDLDPELFRTALPAGIVVERLD